MLVQLIGAREDTSFTLRWNCPSQFSPNRAVYHFIFFIDLLRRLSRDLTAMVFREENEKAINMDFNEKMWAAVGAVLIDCLGRNNSQHYGMFIQQVAFG